MQATRKKSFEKVPEIDSKNRKWWIWSIQRTILFWIVGLFNTALLRPEDVGGWKNWVGWFIIGFAVADTIHLLIRWRSTRLEPQT